MLPLYVDQAVIEKISGAVVGVTTIENIVLSSNSSIVRQRMEKAIQCVREKFTMDALYQDALIQGMRNIYKALGIDPSRYRPSSERLIRRILKGNEPSSIHPIVDICNIVSIQHRMPLGLYDMRKIKGGICLRFGREGESYLGLTDLQISAHEKFIVADDEGPIGSPTTDSVRTKVEDQTDSVLLIVYCPVARRSAIIDAALNDFVALVKECAGGVETGREVRILGN